MLRWGLALVVALLAISAPAQAAVTFSFPAGGAGEGTATGLVATTAAITPVSGDGYCVWVYGNSGTADPTAAGTGGFNGTWTRYGEVTMAGDASQRGRWFCSAATASSSSTLDITDASASGWFYGYTFVRIQGGTGTILQGSTTIANGTSTTAAVTMAAFGSVNNGTLMGTINNADKSGSYSTTPDTLIDAQTVFFSVKSIVTQGNTGNTSAPQATWTGSTDWGAGAIEVEASGGGGGGALVGQRKTRGYGAKLDEPVEQEDVPVERERQTHRPIYRGQL